MSKTDFFIGWSPDTPKADRRFFLTAGIGLGAAALTGGGLLAAHQNAPGRGTWNQGDVRTFTGIATAEPYAMLRTSDIDGQPKTALLACLGKCGVTARIGSNAGKPVSVRGSLIQRGQHTMIAVVDGIDWIMPATALLPEALAFPVPERLGDVQLQGTILDTKCWFGAMRPSSGKVHKACASLCIRGGIPPAFFAQDTTGKAALMIMADQGQAYSEQVLPFVAEPVRVSADLYRMGDLLMLDAPVKRIEYIS